jgi:hypothetical protein
LTCARSDHRTAIPCSAPRALLARNLRSFEGHRRATLNTVRASPDLHPSQTREPPGPVLSTVGDAGDPGGCPHGRARQKKYGVRPNEPVPPQTPDAH